MSAGEDGRTAVAFVVIGRNEGERLIECLQALAAISDQIVYADSASTDDSVVQARSLGVHVVELDKSAPLNAARGRNAGFAEVRRLFPECTYVQFLDGDCIITPEWVQAAVGFLQKDERVAIACGRRFERAPGASFYNRMADDEWNTPVGQAEACGGDSLVRVAAFEEVGGFNVSLMASEEPEMCARLRARGWTIWRLDVPMTEHDARMYRFSQWWRRSLRAGYGYAQAWQSTRSLAQPINRAPLLRAAFWAALVPLTAVLIALVVGSATMLLLIPLVYGLQIARMTLRSKERSWYALRVSTLLVIGKFAEFVGAGRYFVTGGQRHSIDYKSA